MSGAKMSRRERRHRASAQPFPVGTPVNVYAIEGGKLIGTAITGEGRTLHFDGGKLPYAVRVARRIIVQERG
jgi:hypothetical protein